MRAFAVRSFGEPASVQDLPFRPPMARCSFACASRESTRWTTISWDG